MEFSLAEPLNVAALPTSRTPQLDDAVLAVGNALGEGVVIRDGLFTSQTAEEQDGRWKWIRFSAAASPGNSGGPLLDATGRIIGVVIAKSPNENLNYALPIANVLDAPPLQARFDQRALTRLPFAQVSQTYTLKDEFALPLSWDKFNRTYLAVMSRHNDEARAALLTSHADSFFPHGGDSEAILYSAEAASRAPGLVLQQPDGKWVIQAPPLTFTDLPGDGKVGVSPQGDIRSLALHRGDEASDDAFYGDSKAFMDIALKALNLRRQVGTDQVRVDSLGAAISDVTTTDAWGRRWQLRAWPVPFLDVYVVAQLLPTPDGYVGLLVYAPSVALEESKAQLALLANQATLTYEGTTQQWQSFLARPALLSDAFRDVKLQSSPQWSLHTPRFEFGAPTEFLSIDAHSELLVSMNYAYEGPKVAWGIGGARWFQDAQEKVYLGLFRAPKPPASANLETRTRFEDLRAGRSPYDGSPVQATSDAVDVQLGLQAPGAKERTAAADVAYGVALRLNNHPTRAQVTLARASAERAIHILEHGAGSDAVLSPPAAASLPADGLSPEAQRLASEFDGKGQDTRGRVFSDDYRQFVAPLLRKADAPDSKAAAADLARALTDYWNVAPSLVSNREVWSWFLVHNHLPVKTPHSRDVLAAEAALRNLIDKGGAPNAQWSARTKELHDLYVIERKSVAFKVATGRAAPATYQARKAACPAPTGQTSGGERPRLAQAPHSLQEFYPPTLLRREVEGTVVVSLKIDTTGCPTEFAIAASSGDEAFDVAALKWAETTSFLPGEKAGKAITSTTPLAVVFVLTDS